MTLHLGEIAAALVDGQLDHDTRDWALAHLAHCAMCQAEVDAQRRLKVRLAALGAPTLPVALADRLVGLRRSAIPVSAGLPAPPEPAGRPAPDRSIGAFPTAAVDIVSGPAAGRHSAWPLTASVRRSAGPARAPLGGRRRLDPPVRPLDTRGRRVLLGSAAVLALGTAGVFALGGSAGAGTGSAVVPPVGAFVQQHGVTSGGAPLSDPTLTAVTTSFSR